MARTHRRGADDDDDDTLQDGKHLRVPLRLIDQLQRLLADDSDDGAAAHRPGFRVADASSSAERRRIYDDYDAIAAAAWQGKPSGGFIGGREGDVCMVSGPEFPLDFGSPGTMKMVGNKLVCTPDQPRKATGNSDALPLKDQREASYQQYDAALREAWRNVR